MFSRFRFDTAIGSDASDGPMVNRRVETRMLSGLESAPGHSEDSSAKLPLELPSSCSIAVSHGVPPPPCVCESEAGHAMECRLSACGLSFGAAAWTIRQAAVQ
eukprot:gnl/TRDRNA2_/TRDRNA2_29402_c0_seq1.p3 gnl/TRDRNA2_/TRDRNA2_29402_c0~~gnl/TRDRNA2_/TRDRNA2_29402_c0_seq1.p3  ORF type:complete len:103 (+),score=6.58 gnl/TRDRNA2_/TRDRNA2_29402_c0_seq1:510-818(+)